MEKTITYFGRQVNASCDANCDKAWGLSSPQMGLKILSFKSRERAQEICDRTNEISNSEAWKIEQLN